VLHINPVDEVLNIQHLSECGANTYFLEVTLSHTLFFICRLGFWKIILSSVESRASIVAGYRLDGRRTGVQFLTGTRDVSL
jgi:hypothetical protein